MTDDRTARSHLTGLGELTRERIDAGLHRTIAPRRPGPPELLDLASNDYLGMHDHPAVIDAAAAALRGYGLGSTGSRLVTGATVAHDELEDELANFMGFGCALTASSGYLANLAAVTALAGRGDLIVSDGARTPPSSTPAACRGRASWSRRSATSGRSRTRWRRGRNRGPS